MFIRTNLLLQSLLLNYIPSNNQIDDGAAISSNEVYSPNNPFLDDLGMISVPTPPPIPDPNNAALMARFIVHNSNWTSVSYISNQKGSQGRALGDMFAVSDGPVEKGTGVPYFYVTRLEAAVTDLLDHDNQCSLMMSLAQSHACKARDWDPEDPRCAHVVMSGTFQKLEENTAEYVVANISVFTRHPSFRTLPPAHKFFLAKYNIEAITVQDKFGGPTAVPVQEYFAVKSRRFNLKANRSAYLSDFDY